MLITINYIVVIFAIITLCPLLLFYCILENLKSCYQLKRDLETAWRLDFVADPSRLGSTDAALGKEAEASAVC